MSFLCSVLEAVLLSTPMSFITMKESQGNKTASLMKDYKDNVDRPVGAILFAQHHRTHHRFCWCRR